MERSWCAPQPLRTATSTARLRSPQPSTTEAGTSLRCWCSHCRSPSPCACPSAPCPCSAAGFPGGQGARSPVSCRAGLYILHQGPPVSVLINFQQAGHNQNSLQSCKSRIRRRPTCTYRLPNSPRTQTKTCPERLARRVSRRNCRRARRGLHARCTALAPRGSQAVRYPCRSERRPWLRAPAPAPALRSRRRCRKAWWWWCPSSA